MQITKKTTLEDIITPKRLARIEHEWGELAGGEGLKVDVIGNTIYAFGSEIACLRLYRKFYGTGRVCFSESYGSWFYVNE